MTCEEALRKLYEVIDKEASEYDVKEVKAHLQHCRSCLARYQFEEMFRTFVVEKGASHPKAELLKSKISAKIEQYDELPDEKKKGGSFLTSPFRYRSVLLAAAAALVVCILAAFAAAKFYRHRAFVYPIEQIHQKVHAMNLNDSPENLYDSRVGEFINGNLHLAVGKIDHGYKMVSCCFDEFQGKEFAHLRYFNNRAHVSIFVGKPDGLTLPDFDKDILGNIEFYHRECQECQVMYWTIGDAIVIAVTEDKDLDLTEFIPSLATI